MKVILSLFILIICFFTISSCYYDKEDLLYGNIYTPCKDSLGNISYSQHLVPLLRQYCYSCHTGNFPSGGITMGSYTNDKAIAQNGKMLGSVSYMTGYSPMPKNMPRLSNCQVATIKKWIDAGMLNN